MHGLTPFLTVLFLGCAACGQTDTTPQTRSLQPTFERQTVYLNHAQPKLPTVKLWVGKEELITEMARSRVEIATGMMFREKMAENEAMIFVFAQPHRAAFYMRNTYVPLSCAYIGPDGKILEIHDMTPLDESSIEAGTDQVQYVLEVNQGWFKRHKIGVGSLVVTEKGPLKQFFFRR